VITMGRGVDNNRESVAHKSWSLGLRLTPEEDRTADKCISDLKKKEALWCVERKENESGESLSLFKPAASDRKETGLGVRKQLHQ